MTHDDKMLAKLWTLFERAEMAARPPYRRHSAERLAKVHAIHGEIVRLMGAEIQAGRERVDGYPSDSSLFEREIDQYGPPRAEDAIPFRPQSSK